MNTETVIAYSATIATIVAIVVQLVKQAIIDPHTQDSPARDALIRGISYTLNLALLVGFIAWNGQFDSSQVLLYLSLALGQYGVSHVAYSVLSGGSTVGAGSSDPAVSDPANSAISDNGGA